MTLVEFLLARIAEDEEVARAATPGPWYVNEGTFEGYQIGTGTGVEGVTASFPGVDKRGDVVSYGLDREGGVFREEDAAHIARHDPARVLAECEAKRRMVEAVGDDYYGVLNLLALPYADHPDYREEWAP